MGLTGDIALHVDPQSVLMDFSITLGDLANDSGLETAVLLSLFTDRRADDSDALPNAQNDLRGWWADAIPVVQDDRFGSRLWLLAREKRGPTVPPRAEKYAREALQWMLDDGVASKLDVSATITTARDGSLPVGTLLLTVTIWRPDEALASTFRYRLNWVAQAAESN